LFLQNCIKKNAIGSSPQALEAGFGKNFISFSPKVPAKIVP
jgi:hypothetical protein